jgi:hypothetical protein
VRRIGMKVLVVLVFGYVVKEPVLSPLSIHRHLSVALETIAAIV